jgi:dTDP-4-dehydrorhamnose reductase
MTSTILLIGKNGQVGRELNAMLPRLGAVVSLGRNELDLSRPNEIRNVIRSVRPQLIVNAAAYTAVDKAETEESLASAINGKAPGVMAEEGKRIGALLVHYSTDYVFDGSKTSPYSEDDLPNPQSAYGRTKLEGEHAIRQTEAPHLIFRTAWVYAREGRNFLLTMLKLATKREELRIVADQCGTPTWSHEIAGATVQILSRHFSSGSTQNSLPVPSGIYHMTAGGITNWFRFTEAILDEARRARPNTDWIVAATEGLPFITKHVVAITTAEYPTPARRPAYSVLSNERLAKTFETSLPDWREQLRTVFAQSNTY